MKTNSTIRQESRSLLKGNWGSAIGASLIAMTVCCTAVCVASSVKVIGIACGMDDFLATLIDQLTTSVISIFICYPISFACMTIFAPFVRGEQPLRVGDVFYTFKAPFYSKSIGVYFLVNLYTYLWTLLFIVPGIIKALSYSLAPYILADNPELTANQAIEHSMEMMKGHKGQLFRIYLGYFGLTFLSIFGLCIPLIWLVPYYYTVLAKFYEEVKAEYNATNC